MTVLTQLIKFQVQKPNFSQCPLNNSHRVPNRAGGRRLRGQLSLCSAALRSISDEQYDTVHNIIFIVQHNIIWLFTQMENN